MDGQRRTASGYLPNGFIKAQVVRYAPMESRSTFRLMPKMAERKLRSPASTLLLQMAGPIESEWLWETNSRIINSRRKTILISQGPNCAPVHLDRSSWLIQNS